MYTFLSCLPYTVVEHAQQDWDEWDHDLERLQRVLDDMEAACTQFALRQGEMQA